MRSEVKTHGQAKQLLPNWVQRLLLLLASCAFGVLPARAGVAVLVEQPYGGFGAWNPTGHSALYFDHICAASPVQLRACQPGELGVVISRYDGISNHDWIAVPLVPYLYAVEKAEDVPETATKLDVIRMRDLYRREHLEEVAPDTAEGGMPQGNWYELVGSAYDRDIYGFEVKTTAEQDARIMASFNDRPNVERYSGAFRNCADFARITLNRIYPHAVRRNYIADFGLTTPKSVAHGLTRYAHKHPEVELVEFQIPQVKGDLPRSMGIEGVTESLLKRYGVPMFLVSPDVTAAVLVAYVGGHGRFPMPKDAPVLDLAARKERAGSLAAATLDESEPAISGGPDWSDRSDVGERSDTATPAGLYPFVSTGDRTSPEGSLSPVDCMNCMGITLLQ